jgi:hypothetical protein
MVFMRQAQHFHREVLQSQEQLRFVFQKQVRLWTAELHYNVRVFDFRVGGGAFLELVINVDVNAVQQYIQKVADFVFVLFDWIFARHVLRTGWFQYSPISSFSR